MSERKIDIVIGKPMTLDGKPISGLQKISELSRSDRRARRAQVLERGSVGDRLHVPLPEGMGGQWVHNSQEEIFRMEAIGYQIDTEYAKQRALHSNGTDQSIVGDVIFMTCDAETREDIEDLRKIQFDKIHGKQGTRRGEEREFANEMATNQQIPAIMGSRETAVSGADIAQSINAT